MSWSDLPGWTDFEDVYRTWVLTAPRGATIVEVGVAFGRSLAFLAREAIDKRRDDLRIVGVDSWAKQDWIEREHPEVLARYSGDFFQAFVREMGTHATAELRRVVIERGPSVEMADWHRDGSVWAVFIDGGHTEAECVADIDAWLPKVEVGGWCAGHDFIEFHDGVRRAVRKRFGDAIDVMGTSWLHRVR